MAETDTVLFKIIAVEPVPDILMPVSTTILDLKKQIQTRNNVKVGRQSLMLLNNQELLNDKTVRDYNLVPSATIVLVVAGSLGLFQVLVKFRTKETKMEVAAMTMVSELRARIARFWGIPTQNTTLHHLLMEMDDVLPLACYYVDSNSEIEVKVKTKMVDIDTPAEKD